MNTAQITHALEQDPITNKKFCGVFPWLHSCEGGGADIPIIKLYFLVITYSNDWRISLQIHHEHRSEH